MSPQGGREISGSDNDVLSDIQMSSMCAGSEIDFYVKNLEIFRAACTVPLTLARIYKRILFEFCPMLDFCFYVLGPDAS